MKDRRDIRPPSTSTIRRRAMRAAYEDALFAVRSTSHLSPDRRLVEIESALKERIVRNSERASCS